uniref:NAD(P)H dehydrogenase (quinone) n=1 Tax=Physcomitrium patens TaxID=3218 RepID=A0A2K1KEW4_PHYPA|nr:hypothetical protein PHYPA_008698 [Physcomitrium patens]
MAGLVPLQLSTLPADVLTKVTALPKDELIPVITAAQLLEADAFLFGIPTRYGTISAQMKAFSDSTRGLWRGQSLAGKPTGIFVQYIFQYATLRSVELAVGAGELAASGVAAGAAEGATVGGVERALLAETERGQGFARGPGTANNQRLWAPVKTKKNRER